MNFCACVVALCAWQTVCLLVAVQVIECMYLCVYAHVCCVQCCWMLTPVTSWSSCYSPVVAAKTAITTTDCLVG